MTATANHKPLWYLASPYSHPDKEIRKQRFEEVCKAVAYLMNKGVLVFSPIVHCHPVAEVAELPKGFEYWKDYDERMISVCDRFLVFQLQGWKESESVKREIEFACRLARTIYWVDPSKLEEFVKGKRLTGVWGKV
jgi:hypothetical protein